ncbi:nuclear transport factor 2 family protein [Phenylobacterium sp.]|uniref:nuclear transport factor 2 family protein n=1 Tax=Phenylobacterium sp. TaxID=1871053 RepID=UPI0035B3D8DF
MIDATTYGELAQLAHRFWGALDRNDYGGLLRLVTTDCRWNRGGRWREGGADIEAALLERPAGLFVRHLITNLEAELREDGSAVCSYYLSAFSSRAAKDGPPPYPAAAPVLMADYRAVCVRTETGWSYKELGGATTFRAQPAA